MRFATDYELTKWRRYLALRDSREILPGGPRMGICVLCGINVFHRLSNLQAHHIRPKALYPHLALRLDNGVLVCAGHHQGIVHSHNPGVDVDERHALAGWRQFTPLFDRWNDLAEHRAFNLQHQSQLPTLSPLP